MDKKVKELSETLEKKSFTEAECFPTDRYFLEPYLPQIFAINRNDFLLFNLERMNNTYTVQLLLCLPELWEDISVDDLIEIIKQFTNIQSYYTLIQFTYKYVEIDIIELMLRLSFVTIEIKKNIVNDYLISSAYSNLIKTEGDYFFFNKGLYGIRIDEWIYAKQRLLLDRRVKPTLDSMEEIKKYVESLPDKFGSVLK